MNYSRKLVFGSALLSSFLNIAGTRLAAQSYTIRTIAGAPTLPDGSPANSVTLREPFGLVADASGNFYFSDRADHRVRRIARTGVISTVVGSGRAGFLGDGGLATSPA